MGLGKRHIKVEMKGTGGGRWMPREWAKRIANKARRAKMSDHIRRIAEQDRELLMQLKKGSD